MEQEIEELRAQNKQYEEVAARYEKDQQEHLSEAMASMRAEVELLHFKVAEGQAALIQAATESTRNN